MHFVFIPYGVRTEVETLMRDMEAQKHKLKMRDKDGKETFCWVSGAIRELPFGVKEYIFPRENRDCVLNTLMPPMRAEWKHPIGERYIIGWFRKLALKKIFKTEKMPEWSAESKFLWIKDNVNIIPIGIRNDEEIEEKMGGYAGYIHEAL